MNAIIVDDERPARTELKRLLAGHPVVNLVGEASTAAEARELIERLRPELVFLDIEMPEQNGFELIESLPLPHPYVVFTTAYNAYALQAFEVNALDYLLKPINPRRLSVAIEKVARHCALVAAAPPAACPPRVESLPNDDAGTGGAEDLPPLRPADHVFVRDGDRCWFVPVRSLRLLESDGNYTRIHFDNSTPLLYRTLNSMEARLPAELFLRANRSQLINLTMIETIGEWFSGSLVVKLRGGTEVEFSRRQAQLFRSRMSL